MNRFEQYNQYLDKAEGKEFYPQDPSMYGVTKESYEDYLKKKLTKPVSGITYDEAKEVRLGVFKAAKGDKINSDMVAILHADHAYNVGVFRAIWQLQEVLINTFGQKIKLDGYFGINTIAAINSILPDKEKALYDAVWQRRVKWYTEECGVSACKSLVQSRLQRVFHDLGGAISVAPVPTTVPTSTETTKKYTNATMEFLKSTYGLVLIGVVAVVGLFFIVKSFWK